MPEDPHALIGPKPPVPQAPADTFSIVSPTATTGFRPGLSHGGANDPAAAFTPRAGEGTPAARARVIDGVLSVARGNGAEPAANG